MFLIDFILLFSAVYFFAVKLRATPFLGERLALSLLFFLGAKTLHLFALIALGIQPLLQWQTALSLATAIWAVTQTQNAPTAATGFTFATDSLTRNRMIGILAALALLSLANAAFFPITEPDSSWYLVRGLLYYHEANFTQNIFHNEYSPFITLLFSYLESLGVSRPKAIFPLFYICLLVIFYHRVLAARQNQKLAALSTLILGTTPYVWWHSVLPFLNLPAACFFTVGVLFWFASLKNCLDLHSAPETHTLPVFPFLSGLFLGLAAWTRLEFLIYGLFPVGVFWWCQNQNVAGNRFRATAAITVPFLLPTSLWLLTVVFSIKFHRFDTNSLLLICALGWAGLLLTTKASRLSISITRKTRLWTLSGLALIYLILLAWKGPNTLSLPQNILLTTYRTFSFQLFFAFTIFLAVLPFMDMSRRQGTSEKLLVGLLLYYLAVHFIIYSFGTPRWDTLREYLNMTFLRPGNTANSSGTREFLAFLPLLLFYVFGLPRVQSSLTGEKHKKWVGSFYAIVGLNLAVLTAVFIVPRLKFMVTHAESTAEELMETLGAPDMHNMYPETFALLNRIRAVTPETARVFLPPLKDERKSFPLQRLYPRKLVWWDAPGYKDDLRRADGDSFIATNPEWWPQYCEGKPDRVPLGAPGHWLCRVGNAH